MESSRMQSFIPPPAENHSILYSNLSHSPNQDNKLFGQIKLGIEILMFLCYGLFLSFVFKIVRVFITTPSIHENARYVLFVHMLIIDTLYLALGILFLSFDLHALYIPGSICLIVYSLANSTFRITPCNLAFMSLERYVAICFPLRHAELCTVQRANVVIGIIWILEFFPNVIDLIAMGSSFDKIISISLLCSKGILTTNSQQSMIRSLTVYLNFAAIGLVILYTYGKVMLIARQMTTGKASAQKAGKTVMLHAFQLLLYMISLFTNLTDKDPRNYIDFVPFTKFFLLTCVPRYLSPIIYGIRDELLQKKIKTMYSAKH